MSRFPKESSLKRKHSRIEPKIIIYVLCEGKITEPRYIHQFCKEYINDLVEVHPIPGVGVPLTVVEQAVMLKNELLRTAKKTKDSYRMAFSVWCLIDVDEHPNIETAKDLAHVKKIHLCVSNPCFELWGLLHITQHNAHIHRHKLQAYLHEVMPNYHHDNRPEFDFGLIKDQYDTARVRAIDICTRRKKDRTEGCNPSTNVYDLMDCIIANSKKAKK